MGKIYYKKEVLGDGDIMLSSAFGAFLGWQGLVVSLFLGYIIGALIALILITFKLKRLKEYIPFAPALTTGAILALFFGNQIINFYVANFL